MTSEQMNPFPHNRARLSLSKNEIGLVIDALNTGLCPPNPSGREHILKCIDNAITFGYAERWDVHADRLLDKISALSDEEMQYLSDAAQFFWGIVSNGDIVCASEALDLYDKNKTKNLCSTAV